MRPYLGLLAVPLLGLAGTAAMMTRTEAPKIPVAAERIAAVAAPIATPGSELLFDGRPVLGARAATAWDGKPLATAFRAPEKRPGEKLAAAPIAAPAAPAPPPRNLAALAPLPAPRPAELAGTATPIPAARTVERRMSRRARLAATPARIEDNRNFFERLFGLEPSPRPALAYASLDAAPLPATPKPRLSPAPEQQASAGVAIYDISARTVYLPNGERLEAHSGLRDKLDDPRFAHMRMVGATPPGTYDLTEREALFHGVRAIRLNPIGGPGAIHGRAGILAHTYMLGPNGDSNGCVSFRDYDRFLQAFLSGEVKRLVVVAGSRGDTVPNRLFGAADSRDRGA